VGLEDLRMRSGSGGLGDSERGRFEIVRLICLRVV